MSLSMLGLQDIDIIAAKNKDNKLAIKSTSAGVFGLLAEYIITQGGVVCGAAFDDDFNVFHCFAESVPEIEKLRKSKYVKSDLGQTFKQSKEYLENGRKVLYSGTPCQIAALKKYLAKEYHGLLTVDVICHGAPMPWVWKAYLRGLRQQYGGDIDVVEFRKKDGVAENKTGHNLYIKIGDIELCSRDAYMEGFLSGLFLLPSCYECAYKNFSSGSDIQLGDFWGIHDIYRNFCDTINGRIVSDGISEVILITDKGRNVFGEIEDRLISFSVNKNRFFHSKDFGNFHNLTEPTSKHDKSDDFANDARDKYSISSEFIYGYLGISPKKYTFGAIGSLAMSQIFQKNALSESFSLKWHFTASNIISMMSPPISKKPGKSTRPVPFLDQILNDDRNKELQLNFDMYADEADFLVIDLLDERYMTNIVTDTLTTYITDNKLFFCDDVETIPLDTDSWALWKEKCSAFISMITRRFEPSRIFILETYLAKKYWMGNDTILFPNKFLVTEINSELQLKYKFLKDNINGANTMSFDRNSSYANVINHASTSVINPAYHPASLYNFYAKLIKMQLEQHFEPQPMRESRIDRVETGFSLDQICTKLI